MVPNAFSSVVGLLAIITIWLYLCVRGPRTLETFLIALVGTVVIVATIVYWPTLFAFVAV